MYYNFFKKHYQEGSVLVYIEEYNRKAGIVVFDFIDSNEYYSFTKFGGLNKSLSNPTMVIMKNYYQRTIQENTIYAINKEVIENWREMNLFNLENTDSFLIGYTIVLSSEENKIFFKSVSFNDYYDNSFISSMRGGGDLNSLPIEINGKLSVTVRNVGQGNWNEINEDDKTKIIFDVGASMYAKKSEIRNLIETRTFKYSKEKPGLILSHWDKDHYHALLGMNDVELANFSFFICRDIVPNLTSRILFNRISNAIGHSNIYTISAEPRITRGGRTQLVSLSPIANQLMIYNAQYHKNRNISGLVVSLKTKTSSIILSGDCHYDQISFDILPDLNFNNKHHLVVPHHGGKAGNYIYNLPTNVTPGNAIISVGVNNYGHPIQIYTDSLKLSGFNLIKMQKKQNDITINL